MILLWMPEYRGSHPMAWREEQLPPNVEMDFDLVSRQIRTAERGKLHGVLMADTLAVGYYSSDISNGALSYTAKGSRWEPLTLLSALSTCTNHIGLLGTVNTTFAEPFNVARMLASLDHISGGRAGVSAVSTSHPSTCWNFGRAEPLDEAGRFGRWEEFLDVLSGLWDSWEDDAFVRDRESGIYFELEKLHTLNHRGKQFSVAGPLNIARPAQGRPVVVHTGDSRLDIACRTADVICNWPAGIASGKQIYEEVKARAVENGRNPDDVKVLPAIVLSVGRTRACAEERLARLDKLIDPVFGMELLRGAIQADLSGHPLDGPVPAIAENAGTSASVQRHYLDVARRGNLTIRELMQTIARVSVTPGSPLDIADLLQEWIEAGAADGFTITFDNDADSLESFVDDVVPELQRRGLFHTEYSGTTLRENLGLPRPMSRYGGGEDSCSKLGREA